MHKIPIPFAFTLLFLFCSVNFAQDVKKTGIPPVETIRLFEETGDLSKTPVITCLDISKDGKLLAVGGDDRIVRIWDFSKKRFVWESQPYEDWVRGLCFNFDHSLLVTAAQSGQICLWSVVSAEKPVLLQTLETAQGAQKIIFHPQKNQFAVCGFEKYVYIFEVNNQLIIQQTKQLETPATANRAIAYSPDGKFLAVGGRSGIIRLRQTGSSDWSFADIENIDKRRINALAFSPDSSKLAAGGDGPFITLWSTATKKQIEKTLNRDYGKTFSLAFCSENILASGESDNVIRLWDIQRAKVIGEYSGHQGTIASMICAGNALVSGSFDTTIRLWDVNVPAEKTAEKTAEIPVFPAVQ